MTGSNSSAARPRNWLGGDTDCRTPFGGGGDIATQPAVMEKQKWWGQDSGLSDLKEKINAASCGEEELVDCPGPRKETDGLHVTQGDIAAMDRAC